MRLLSVKVVNLTKGEVADFLLEEGMLKHYPFLLDVVSGTQRLLGVFGLPFCLFNPSHTQKGEKKEQKNTRPVSRSMVRLHPGFLWAKYENIILSNKIIRISPISPHLVLLRITFSLKFLLRLHRWKISVNESMACCSFPVASRPYCSFFGSDQLEPYWQWYTICGLALVIIRNVILEDVEIWGWNRYVDL